MQAGIEDVFLARRSKPIGPRRSTDNEEDFGLGHSSSNMKEGSGMPGGHDPWDAAYLPLKRSHLDPEGPSGSPCLIHSQPAVHSDVLYETQLRRWRNPPVCNLLSCSLPALFASPVICKSPHSTEPGKPKTVRRSPIRQMHNLL